MCTLPHHNAAAVVDNDPTLLLKTPRADLDNPPLSFGFRFTFIQYFRFRIECVAGEQRVGQLDLVPAQRETIFAYISHAHSSHDGKGQSAIDQTPAEFRTFSVFVVEVDLICVVSQE